MSTDPKITDTFLYGKPYGDRLCMEQRTVATYIWDNEWGVFGDQLGHFVGREIKHVAVQFRRRPARKRYEVEPFLGRFDYPRVKELEDA